MCKPVGLRFAQPLLQCGLEETLQCFEVPWQHFLSQTLASMARSEHGWQSYPSHTAHWQCIYVSRPACPNMMRSKPDTATLLPCTEVVTWKLVEEKLKLLTKTLSQHL